MSIFISIKDDLLKYQIMEYCGQTYSSNFALRRHIANTHKPSSGIYRCFAEKCRKNFRRKASFVQHQLTHHYISEEFHLMTQAFQGTTLILRRNLRDQGIYGLDFLLEPQTISEISKILNSEVSKKNSIVFKLAAVLNFFKTDLNGDDTTVQPVFCSNNIYLNSVTEFVTEDILKASLPTIKERFDDFVSKGSGKEILFYP